ncbi:transposase [Nostoc commune NIES-4072]|uniref:Transposase n=1 Tax=Nostoc commune NIES-4072 TaxID=2005467 RepID=A0A2R5G2M5_NOSCO|nr:hypothetical protein [Nostoc commune]BBD70055.1 transposase [Nostoc commune HK-02]GBG22723.1 transposase [Nostoc commune NIES-4072]
MGSRLRVFLTREQDKILFNLRTADVPQKVKDRAEGEQREKVRSGFSSQLHPYILNKIWFFSCDRILKQAIYVPDFSTSQNRVAPILCLERTKLQLLLSRTAKTFRAE